MAKVVLITDANKGIGFEVACQLGCSGFTVLLGHATSRVVKPQQSCAEHIDL
ncbi:hypothetical protein [Granulicella sp. WH15]|uniref:hypothetical protein n=1 Tax=Granulicella sp. WH15 TaxID=2602070 RepID=UPI0021030EFD|nr:hypothetical protein [Granulicella sp. WH15]